MMDEGGARIKRKIAVARPQRLHSTPRPAPVISSFAHRIGRGGAPVYQSKVYPSRNWEPGDCNLTGWFHISGVRHVVSLPQNPGGLQAICRRDRPTTGRRLARIPAGTPKTGSFPGPSESPAISGPHPGGMGKGALRKRSAKLNESKHGLNEILRGV